jgi:subtilisin family serine protease
MQSVFDRFYDNPGNHDNPLTGLGGMGNDYRALFEQAYNDSARIHNNPWGSPEGTYGGVGDKIDAYLWEKKDMVVLFAAGNKGAPQSISREASSKNCIAVGASESEKLYETNNRDFMASFSSRGPTGCSSPKRCKPDIVAPETPNPSARSSHVRPWRSSDLTGVPLDKEWCYQEGTSMGCALVAGCCAVTRGCLVDNGIQNSSAALIKALLINRAVEMKDRGSNKIESSPSLNSGFG